MDIDTLKKIRAQMEISESHVPGFRPQAPYVGSFHLAEEYLSKQEDAEALWMYAAGCLDEFKRDYKDAVSADVFVPEKKANEYIKKTMAKPRGDEKEYIAYATRDMDTLDFPFDGAKPELDEWGGRQDISCQKTGFFHLERRNGRYLLVDPDGHPCYMTGISDVNANTSPNVEKNALEKYGTLEKWGTATVKRLKDLGFTCGGMWSDNAHLEPEVTGEKWGLSGTLYFITTYGDENQLTKAAMGHSVFTENNTMPVFDPGFEAFAEHYAQEKTAAFKDRENMVGWFSDNELPATFNMLERYLTLDPGKSCNRYSLAVAWLFLKEETGKENPTLADVTDDLQERFRGMVYNRYFRVVNCSLKKADPNHLYLGCRFQYLGPNYREGTLLGEGMMRAAGRWCDVVSINYYFAWEPDGDIVRRWLRWSGKPFLISEWYAMSVNSGLACVTGAGFKVESQKDRGAFYQNFALWLLECPWCVGFHWFKYMDNDPENKNAEASNVNGNKGIMTTKFEEWEELTEAMGHLNHNIYRVMDGFDKRNKEA